MTGFIVVYPFGDPIKDWKADHPLYTNNEN